MSVAKSPALLPLCDHLRIVLHLLYHLAGENLITWHQGLINSKRDKYIFKNALWKNVLFMYKNLINIFAKMHCN